MTNWPCEKYGANSGEKMAVPEDETGEVSSYADTMASLLSLLSHPEEFDDPAAMDVNNATAADGIQADINRTAKSVIFIMDEFDLFTTHPRQTLLYNLFDIAQAKKAPVAVIGCSTRMDVIDCLEKRVKSRFSHRWLHVPAAKSLVAFEETLRDVLCLPVEGKEALGVAGAEMEWRTKWNEHIKVSFMLRFRGPTRRSSLIRIDAVPSRHENSRTRQENLRGYEIPPGLADGTVCPNCNTFLARRREPG